MLQATPISSAGRRFCRAAISESRSDCPGILPVPSNPPHCRLHARNGCRHNSTGLRPGASDVLGQQIVVEDKPGAGSSIAAEYVARAAKDGYTLFLSSLSIVTSQIINPDPAFDLDKDFAPISLLASGAVVLVVSPQSNLSSVGDLIAMAKSDPGQVLCANAGIGSLPHMAAELFAQRAGIKLVHVPNPGSPQAVTDLVAGRVTMFFLPRFDRDWTDRSRQTQSARDGGK